MIQRVALCGVALLFLGSVAHATECPKDTESCKVLTLSPEEEQTLLLFITQTGVHGPYNQVKGAVEFWTKKITGAPAGNVPKPEKK